MGQPGAQGLKEHHIVPGRSAFKPSPATPLPHRHRRPRQHIPGRRHHQPTRRRLRHPQNHRGRPPRPPRRPSPQRTDGMGRQDPHASGGAACDRIAAGRRRRPVRSRRTDRRQPLPTRRRPSATPTRLGIASSPRTRAALSDIGHNRRAVPERFVGPSCETVDVPYLGALPSGRMAVVVHGEEAWHGS